MKPHKLLTDSFLPVLLVVIVGAYLFSGMPVTKEDLVSPTPTPAPDNGGGGGGGGTNPAPVNPTPTQAPWAISHTFLGCNISGFPKIKIDTRGDSNGYISLEIDDGGGNYKILATTQFNPPGGFYMANLANGDGFNTKKWRVVIFSGGSVANNIWSGGVIKATDEGVPTGCN